MFISKIDVINFTRTRCAIVTTRFQCKLVTLFAHIFESTTCTDEIKCFDCVYLVLAANEALQFRRLAMNWVQHFNDVQMWCSSDEYGAHRMHANRTLML